MFYNTTEHQLIQLMSRFTIMMMCVHGYVWVPASLASIRAQNSSSSGCGSGGGCSVDRGNDGGWLLFLFFLLVRTFLRPIPVTNTPYIKICSDSLVVKLRFMYCMKVCCVYLDSRLRCPVGEVTEEVEVVVAVTEVEEEEELKASSFLLPNEPLQQHRL